MKKIITLGLMLFLVCAVAAFAGGGREKNSQIISIGKVSGTITGDHHFFADEQTSERIIFRTKEVIYGFAYIEIIPSEDSEGNFVLLVGEQLFSTVAITPTMPVVVSVSIGSGIPARGIQFEYEGTVKYFYITESGMDGSLQLVEFTPFFE